MPALSLSLDHQRGVWKDRLTGETFKSLTFVFLGADKKRSMWFHIDALDGRREVCSSEDGVTGTPKSGFPWTLAPEMEDLYDHGTGAIKCEECVFRMFDKHTWKKPPCAAHFVCPILFTDDPSAPFDQWQAAYLNVRGSSVREFTAARDRITATDDVWFSRMFTTKPIMKSLKGKMFAAANIQHGKKVDYTAADLITIDRKFTQLETDKTTAPETSQGLKGVLGIKKGN